MLYLKSWHESRIRFLLSLVFLCGISSCVVFYFAYLHRYDRFRTHPSPDYAHYIWAVIFKGGNSVREMFVLIVLFLPKGLAGLAGSLWALLQRRRVNGISPVRQFHQTEGGHERLSSAE